MNPSTCRQTNGCDARPPVTTQILWSVFFAALAIRLVLAACVFGSVAEPTIDHNNFGWEMGWTGRSIALGQGFSSPFLPLTGPTALVPPVYPCLLAGVFRIFGLYSAHSALAILSLGSLFSAITCLPIFYSVQHGLNSRLARWSAIAWCVYPLSIYFAAGIVWDYALTSLLFTLCFCAVQRLSRQAPWGWAGFGVLAGITALSNPSIILLIPLLLLIPMLQLRRSGGHWLASGCLAMVTLLAVCTPWGLRNQRVMHTASMLRDGFWLEFWAGNNGDTFESNAAWAHPASNPVEMRRYQAMGETAYMVEKQTLSVDFTRHHPTFVIRATGRRILRFWTGYWSFESAYIAKEPFDIPNVFFCTALTLLMLRGLLRWWHLDRAGVLPYLLVLAVFPLPYYLTHSSMDYRQPIEPEIVTLVVVGLFGTSRTGVSEEEAQTRGGVGARGARAGSSWGLPTAPNLATGFPARHSVPTSDRSCSPPRCYPNLPAQ